MLNNLKIISAGAGSGKTYRLTSEMVELLQQGVRANGIIATTFTTKAAAELQERVRVRLLEAGMTREADDLTNALIGTVHGLGVKLLQRFAFEAGVSPEVEIIADEDQQTLFNQSLASVMHEERVEAIEGLCDRLGLNKNEHFDWRRDLKFLTDVARANDFSLDVLEKSKIQSFESFLQFLEKPSEKSEAYFQNKLKNLLDATVESLENNGDSTKKTSDVVAVLKSFRRELDLRGELYWHQWAKISKIDVGIKSKADVEELKVFAGANDTHPAFQRDIRDFIYHLFDIAIEALREYDAYKKRRGLIDYTDMEVLVKRLLENEAVQEVLASELDLLMVDEFQDTSPLQLEIFLKLSKLAKYSVWVGDPKQSIYGFRGAEPRLMQAIIDKNGGVQPENIQKHSWRSREDLVFASNALFTKAFQELPEEQIALEPKRLKKDEPIELNDALLHWHFTYDGNGRQPGKPWMENSLAQSLKQVLERGIHVLPKDEKVYRAAKPGDVAILCRSNAECLAITEALHRAGLRAAISRSGLLNTAEAKLIFACLKFCLNQYDSLSIAELLLLASGKDIEEIIENRLDYLEQKSVRKLVEAGAMDVPNLQEYGASKSDLNALDAKNSDTFDDRLNAPDFLKSGAFFKNWGEDDPFIHKLKEICNQTADLSSAEILNLLLEELDLCRIISNWGNKYQRLDNVDVLRKLSLQYENACNRLHTAASLGGFLLWLNDLESNKKDMQGSGEGPNAVNVMTYHKSKGLEYPIVICYGLEGTLRSDVWGIDIIPETEDVDLNNVLGNRWLRYWVNPYNDQYRGTPLAERIEVSEVKASKTAQALQEEARLLYVGLTRARDYLVIPTTQNRTKWLNRVWHKGKEDYPTLDHDSYESPWSWQGKFLAKQTEIFPYPKDFPKSDIPEGDIHYLEARFGRKHYTTYYIDPENEGLHSTINVTTSTFVQYASPLLMADDADAYQVAKMIKACLVAFHADYSIEEQAKMLNEFITRYNLAESLKINDLHRNVSAWMAYLEMNVGIKKIYCKYPIRYFEKGQLFERLMDFLLETDRGYILIQSSGFSGDASKLRNKALELGNFFHLSKLAVQDIFKTKNVRTLVHFVLHGTMVEIG